MMVANCLTAPERLVGLPELKGLVVLVRPPGHLLVRAVPHRRVWLTHLPQAQGPYQCLKAKAVQRRWLRGPMRGLPKALLGTKPQQMQRLQPTVQSPRQQSAQLDLPVECS
jgi:hypothetical protein